MIISLLFCYAYKNRLRALARFLKMTKNWHPRGMTLIEILIVVALIASVTTLAMISLGVLSRADVSGASLKFSASLRYTFNMAATSNKTLQMRINFDKNTYFVDEISAEGGLSEDVLKGTTMRTAQGEKQQQNTSNRNVLDEEDSAFGTLDRGQYVNLNDDFAREEAIAQQVGDGGGELNDAIVDLTGDGAKDVTPIDFSQKAKRDQIKEPFLSGEDATLPDGVHFLGVMTSHHDEEQSDGEATINFFPSGFVERSVIFVGNDAAKEGASAEDGAIIYSLLVNPINGHTTIVPGRVDLDEAFFAPQKE